MANKTIKELSARVKDFIYDRDWQKYHQPKDIAIAISTEAAELLEIFLWSDVNKQVSKKDLQKIKNETADVVIYAISMANACSFDLGDAIIDKIGQNEEKYPVEKSHDIFN